MAKNKISEYDSTAGNNTDINSINIDEGCSPSGINNAIRALMAHLKNFQTGTEIDGAIDKLPIAAGGTGVGTAAEAKTALGAASTGTNSDITALTALTTPLTLMQGGTGGAKSSITYVARASNVATITTSSAHGYVANNKVTLSGITTSGFNASNVTVVSAPTSTTFTYANTGSDVSSTADSTGVVISLTSMRSNLGMVFGTDVAGLGNTQSFTKAQIVTPVALTSSSASIAVDASLSNNFTHTFTENTTLANPSNLVAGQGGIIVFTQHASSPKTLAFGSYWKFPSGTAPSVTATNSAVDILVYYVESTSRITAKLIADVK
ncbi:hypothetical protein UFOVP89_44 [uncultured Caudovirales phage]|uniref:Tail fiber protein n=1 Tax=uncultured Caudovirales phage TaxID=2100421 RepID=A0A6J5KZD9_9CAUD|nr:hypothetical protein UFOVP89_44 [uncultured Caudovirales phage]